MYTEAIGWHEEASHGIGRMKRRQMGGETDAASATFMPFRETATDRPTWLTLLHAAALQHGMKQARQKGLLYIEQ